MCRRKKKRKRKNSPSLHTSRGEPALLGDLLVEFVDVVEHLADRVTFEDEDLCRIRHELACNADGDGGLSFVACEHPKLDSCLDQVGNRFGRIVLFYIASLAIVCVHRSPQT